MEPFDPRRAAQDLAQAWRSGTPLPEFPGALRPRTMADGYAIQDAFMAALGEPVVGWKLGAGSPNAKRGTGLAVPLVGQVPASRAFRSGDVIVNASGRPLVAEFEIAFVLQRDVHPDQLGSLSLAIVCEAHAAFELVQPRVADKRGLDGPAIVSDNAFSYATVLGEAVDLATLDDVVGGLRVSLDGRVATRGLSGQDLVDPLQALDEFAAHARERRIGLRRGHLILTGTLTLPFDVPATGGTLKARYGDGELTCRVESFPSAASPQRRD